MGVRRVQGVWEGNSDALLRPHPPSEINLFLQKTENQYECGITRQNPAMMNHWAIPIFICTPFTPSPTEALGNRRGIGKS